MFKGKGAAVKEELEALRNTNQRLSENLFLAYDTIFRLTGHESPVNPGQLAPYRVIMQHQLIDDGIQYAGFVILPEGFIPDPNAAVHASLHGSGEPQELEGRKLPPDLIPDRKGLP